MNTDLLSREERAAIDATTAELRAVGWCPPREFLCGCNPGKLCALHAERRAVDHYHPETIR